MSLVKGPRDSAQFITINDKIRFKQGIRLDDSWGNEWYVDFENGVDGAGRGRSAATPFKNLAYALTAAAAWDVIYVRPRTPDVAGGDPQAITPATAANWSIPNTHYGLQIIGCGRGHSPHQAAYQTRLQGESTVTGVSPITVLAPYVVLEKLSIKRGGSTGVPLVNLSSVAAAYAFGAELYGCQLHMGNGTAAGSAAVLVASHWYASILKCHFERCGVGIGFTSTLANPAACVIEECTFNQVTGANYGDIVSAATAVNRLRIHNNIFEQADPTLGTTVYIYMNGSSNTGIVSNNYFGTATLVTATIMTLGGLVEAGSKCAKGFLTS